MEEWKERMEGWKIDQDFQDFQDFTRIRGKIGRLEEKNGRMEGWKEMVKYPLLDTRGFMR